VTPEERLGYEIPGPTGRRSGGGTIAVSASDVKVLRDSWWQRIRAEERVGLLAVAAGLYLMFQGNSVVPNWSNLQQLMATRPAQLAALGALLWLHAKWRRATRVV
jgi:hypothetical protein